MFFKTLPVKRYILLFFLILLQSSSFGQDFQWVYTTFGNSSAGSQMPDFSQIYDVVLDNQDNIYILGRSEGEQDFSDGAGTDIVNSESQSLTFIVKLDKNKSVVWVKHFNIVLGVGYNISQLHIDANNNLLLIGSVSHPGVSFIDLDPDPGEQQTIQNPSFFGQGVIIKLNSNGNYITSRHYDSFVIRDLAFDSNQNIIAVGLSTTEIFGDPIVIYNTARVYKLDSYLNSIWTYEFDGPSITAGMIIIDNEDNLILRGKYKDFINFAGQNYQNEESNFICKLNSDSSEEWLIEQEIVTGIENSQTINQNILHVAKTYNASSSFVFENTTISNLPYQEGNGNDAVLFTMDIYGNYISHFTFSGLTDQNITGVAINEFNEFIIGLITGNQVIFRDSNNVEIANFKSDGEQILLKISSTLELINFIELDHQVRYLELDTENNIIIGGNFRRDTDFDPHAINEYNILNTTQRRLFVAKLSYCEAFPPTGDDLIFCSDENPTVADLEANEYNISWYSSVTSTAVLDNTIPLQDGQTYYAKKNKEDHCPEIFERLAVLVTVNPTPPAPVLAAIQPCYNPNFRLEDINIDGVNVDFFATLTTTVKLTKSTIVDPDVTYYMSQTISGCESERLPFSFPAQSAVSVNNHTVNLCDTDKNNTEQVNLSNYISYLLNGNENDFTISYHNTQADAENGSNAIENFEEYQANTQNIYVRFLYNDYSCYQIATLTINVSSPPEITEIIMRDGTSSSNSITVLPLNPQYLYSIDGINYQSSNAFENVLAGEYLVYVKDSLEACGEVSEKVYLITYPKFFTPNGDGYNDFWKIKYAQFQFAVDVEIYDRYGKLLTSFDKNSPGWDGKSNGENLPSTDYWFKVTRFIDKKVIHRGHFSLKR